jgi:hypothetical protein
LDASKAARCTRNGQESAAEIEDENTHDSADPC